MFEVIEHWKKQKKLLEQTIFCQYLTYFRRIEKSKIPSTLACVKKDLFNFKKYQINISMKRCIIGFILRFIVLPNGIHLVCIGIMEKLR